MANVPNPPIPIADEPTTFRELFEGMDDVYQGIYQPMLHEYRANDQVPAPVIMQNTVARWPVDQVPAVFLFQDPIGAIRMVHHIHQVAAPIGQPPTPLTDLYLGFSGEVIHGQAQLLQLPDATFFSNTGEVTVPTDETLTAQLAVAADGFVGPYNPGDPDTEQVNTRRAVPVPRAYVPLVTFRLLTAQQAWQQIGEQIILDGRAADCRVFLDFIKVATVRVRGAIRNQPPGLPVTCQLQAFFPPLDGPLLEHTHRKLRQLLPAAFQPPAHARGVPMAQTVALVNQTVADGFEAIRADRILEREAAAIPKTFTEVFPAMAMGVRRLCLAGNEDELLPQFWRFFASVKGKKAQSLSAFMEALNRRANDADSTKVKPVVSTSLWVNISSFELGASDLEIITQGISPFLMCPTSYTKAKNTTILTQKYLMLQGEHSLPMLSDIQQLIPSNDYSIPDDLYTLADFVGAYSIIWDVLVGVNHPLATSIRNHYSFWRDNVRVVINALPEAHMRNVLIIGTMRHIQLAVLSYVNTIMYTDAHVAAPTFDTIVQAVTGRVFHTLPALPASYQQPVPPSTYRQSVDASTLPPVVPYTPTPPRSTPVGKSVIAPVPERIQTFIDAFTSSGKTIPHLRTVTDQPKSTRGGTTLCLSYHLRGICFDNCGRKPTHRKLDKKEEDNMKAFVAQNL